MRRIKNCCVLLLAVAFSSCYASESPLDLSRDSSGNVFPTIYPVPMECDPLPKVCNNGEVLYRDPYNNCRFPKCNNGCPDDVHVCKDRSIVTRNPDTCLFYPCKNQCPGTGNKKFRTECTANDTCDDGMYCEKGDPNSMNGDKGWCCPGPVCREDNSIIHCIDNENDRQRKLNRGVCYPPYCKPRCPDGAEPARACSPGGGCGYEHFCIYRLTPQGQKSHGVCCPSKNWQRLCKYERHMWKDYRRFLRAHKKLMSLIPTPGDPRVRVQVDQIYGCINTINQLICDIEEKKRKIEDGQLDSHSMTMIRCLWRTIRRLWYKSNQMRLAVNKLKKLLTGADQQTCLTELDNLIVRCMLEGARTLYEEVHFQGIGMMLELIPVELDDSLGAVAYNICKKAKDLGVLYHKALMDFGDIYENSFLVFNRTGKPGMLPVEWFQPKLTCVDELALLYYDLRECCEKIATKQIDINKLVKKLGAWLTKAMELREKLRKCFPKKKASTVLKNSLTAIGEDDEGKNIGKSFERRFKRILKEYDDCIIKLRCLFVQMITDHWSP